MKNDFTGVSVLNITHEFLQMLRDRKSGACTNSEQPNNLHMEEMQIISQHALYSNMGIVLKTPEETVLARTSRDNQFIWILDNNVAFMDHVKARNKEQIILANLLKDNEIKLQIIIGKAGSGKTILTSSYALHSLLKDRRYERIIFTKPMTSVGYDSLGAMPGDLKDKFSPYLLNFKSNLEQILGISGMFYHDDLERTGRIMYLPIQILRGASFINTLVIADEVQNCNFHQTRTIGTRLGEGSKLVMLGDLTQIDAKLKPNQTGLYHLMHSEIIKKNPIASCIELIKNERSDLSNLIDEAFTDTNP